VPQGSRVLIVAAVLAAWSFGPSVMAADDGRSYSQAPEVAPSENLGEAPAVGVEKPVDVGLERGPSPSWIWGPDENSRYFLKTSFDGGSIAARLKATCDNEVTIFLNGQRILSSDDWQEPIEADVQRQIRPGRNELIAEVTNQGSAAGFLCKLALKQPDGSVRYVVSDASWTAAARRDSRNAAHAHVIAPLGQGPWGDVFSRPASLASKRGVFEVLPGFRVERLFTVPRDELGSWVSLTFDGKGRLIVSDEGNHGLARVTPAPLGGKGETKVERLKAAVTSAQGLLVAFGSLYVSGSGDRGNGLYRLRDTDGDDQYDHVTYLKEIRGGGEHGPHGLRLTPDGKSIVLVAGNHTQTPEGFQSSLLPLNWSEDQLLPRQWDANGHARGILAPGGWIARTDPGGKTWEIMSSGYRNSYDIAFNHEGELFAYDSDMEWDMGMPWYRPTRAVHATSGSEFGWRSGTGKWPAYYVDSLPPMVNIGPGSPVGVTFGYGAKFPAKYQRALYLCDWTFGTIYALHLEPQGSTYKAVKTEFLTRTPLPLTDAAVGPDGALYFTIGGRGTQSELFRVTYAGTESTAPADLTEPRMADQRALRRSIEEYHRKKAPDAVIARDVYPHLNHPDRFIRYAARVALEHQPPALWQDRVLGETNTEALITGAVALARQGDRSLQPRLIAALERLSLGSLPEEQQLELARAWSLVFIRMGAADSPTAARLVRELDGNFPGPSTAVNRELCILLVYLKSPTVVPKTMALLRGPDAATAESMSELLARNPGYGGSIARMLATRPDAQKLHYAFVLRNATVGWTLDLRKEYFGFLRRAQEWSGGASFHGFLKNIAQDAYENATDSERLAIEATGARAAYKAPELPRPRGPGHEWSKDEILALTGTKLKSGRNFANGKRAFEAARCVVCHRFGGDGGATGPDLTQAAGRFGVKDLVEAITEPSRVVSDQYRASIISTDAGQIVTGRVVNESGDSLIVVTDPEDSSKVVEIPKKSIEATKTSTVSLMPEKLLSPLNQDEVLDLVAYLLSRGDASDAMFRRR
jgi:putative heme-binding domain-containing protein